MKYFFLLLLLASNIISKAQNIQKIALRKSINRDSLLNILTRNLPTDYKEEINQQYRSGSDKVKEFFLFMLSMPRSSKGKQIKNIDSNYLNVSVLKSQYQKLVPSGHIVSIEFNPADINFNIKESISMRITITENNESKISQEWYMEFNSEKLNTMLQSINWNYEILNVIRKLLVDANCISIENGEVTTVGFSRSGLGEYSYLVFDKDLNDNQKKKYNDGCRFIFYKKNIVLQYEGGATGPQCFPDKDN